MDLTKYYTIEEAAVAAGCSSQTIYSRIKRGDLMPERVLNRTLLLKTEVDALKPLPMGRPPKADQ